MVDVNSPEQAVRLMDEAFNRGDVEAVLSFYEDDAVVVTEPGRMARGQSELRAFRELNAKQTGNRFRARIPLLPFRLLNPDLSCRFKRSMQRFFSRLGAVTTAKWNHREEQLILRYTRGDEAKPFAWGRPLSE